MKDPWTLWKTVTYKKNYTDNTYRNNYLNVISMQLRINTITVSVPFYRN